MSRTLVLDPSGWADLLLRAKLGLAILAVAVVMVLSRGADAAVMYVTDYDNSTGKGNILKYDTNTGVWAPFLSIAALNTQGITYPTGLAVDSGGNVYVANYSTGKVVRFDASGGGATQIVAAGVNSNVTELRIGPDSGGTPMLWVNRFGTNTNATAQVLRYTLAGATAGRTLGSAVMAQGDDPGIATNRFASLAVLSNGAFVVGTQGSANNVRTVSYDASGAARNLAGGEYFDQGAFSGVGGLGNIDAVMSVYGGMNNEVFLISNNGGYGVNRYTTSFASGFAVGTAAPGPGVLPSQTALLYSDANNALYKNGLFVDPLTNLVYVDVGNYNTTGGVHGIQVVNGTTGAPVAFYSLVGVSGFSGFGPMEIALYNPPTPVFATQPQDGESLMFGNVRIGTSVTHTLTASNTGDAGSSLAGDFPQPSDPELSAAGVAPFSLTASQAATRSYTYTPTGHGSDSESLTITSNAGDAVIEFQGAGVGPELASSAGAGPIDFGDVGNLGATPLIFTIQNVTTDGDLGDLTALTLIDAMNWVIDGPDASLFSILSVDFMQLAGSADGSGGLATIMLLYSGDGSLGEKLATLHVVTDVGAALGEAGGTFNFELVANAQPSNEALAMPEPATAGLLGLAGLVMLGRRRRLSRENEKG